MPSIPSKLIYLHSVNYSAIILRAFTNYSFGMMRRSMHVSQTKAISMHHWTFGIIHSWKQRLLLQRCLPHYLRFFTRELNNRLFRQQLRVIDRHFYHFSSWCMTRNKQISWNLRGQRIDGDYFCLSMLLHSLFVIDSSSFMIESFCCE